MIGPAAPLLALALGAGPSEPSALPARLTWSAPPGCPSRAEFEADVQALAAGTLRIDAEAEAVVAVAITEVGEGFSLALRLELQRAVQVRTLTSARCDTLARAAGLITAVAVAPLAASRAVSVGESQRESELEAESQSEFESESEVESEAESESVAELRSEAGVDPRAPTRDGDPVASRFIVRAFTGLGLGLVPGPGFGLGGWIGWQRRRLMLLASGEHWFARTASVAGGGVSIAATGGGVSACVSILEGTVEVPVCGEAVVLAVRGTGEGPGVTPRPQTEAWIGVGPAGGLIWWPWARVGLSAHASGRVGARLPAFHLRRGEDVVDVFRSPPIALATTLGAIVRLP